MTNNDQQGVGNAADGGASSPVTRYPSRDIDEDEISLLDIAVVIAENLRLLIFGPLAAGLVALGIAFLITPTYTARTSFLPPQQQQSASAAMMAQLGALAGVAASAAGLKNPADQYVALLKSTSVADRLVDQFKLIELYEVDFRQDARKKLADNTKVSAGKDGLVVVQVDDHSPQRAAEMANAYVKELQVLLGRLALTEAQQRRVFFEKQLEDTRNNLAEAERALAASGMTPGAVKANPEAAVELVATLQAQVTAQEVKLAAMRGYLTDSAPELVQAQNELAALRAQLRRQEVAEPGAAKSGGYIDRYRNFKYHETLFELFARQFELAKVDEAREGAVIQVVDTALPPERKSKPKKALIAVLTTLATGFALMLLVFVRGSLQNARHDPESAAKLAAVRTGFGRVLKRGT
jgi:uncharacterized protein involved in exopolysaccharide biosynthesis